MGTVSAQQPNGEKRKIDQAEKFTEVLNLIRNYYTDTVNEEKLVEDAIVKALEDLDPHSSYVPGKDVKQSEEPLVANFDGIGITFQILKDTIMVLEVISGGPSEKVGLRAGDKIVMVNDSTVAGIKIDQDVVKKKLRGPKGTKVKVGIMRKGERNLIDFNITRDKIPIYSITASYIAAPGVGYIKLERFSASSLQEFFTSVTKLRGQGMQHLIIDLQGNVGGYLYTAIDLCNQFLGDKELIVYTQGVHSSYQPAFSNNMGIFKEGKVVVMIDEGSASASEILSGCIQDNDRGLLVGRRTFGKGLVQKPFTLSDGSQLKLTTAHYYTPSGRCIQKPYTPGNNKEYRDDSRDRYQSGELFGKDTFKYTDSVKYYTKNKRSVFAGGGVQPDFFVPIDTSMNSTFVNLLIRKGVENKFTLDYVDKYRKELNEKYPIADSFFHNFTVDSSVYLEYFQYAIADSVVKLKKEFAQVKFSSLTDFFNAVEPDTSFNIVKDFEKSRKILNARLKSQMGRNLFDTNLFWKIFNTTVNDSYAKALEVITTDNKFDILLPKVIEDQLLNNKKKIIKKKIKVTSEKTK
jgi:carboxyl-terminal processing protease